MRPNAWKLVDRGWPFCGSSPCFEGWDQLPKWWQSSEEGCLWASVNRNNRPMTGQTFGGGDDCVNNHDNTSQDALMVCLVIRFSTASGWNRMHPEVSRMTGIFWASIQRSRVRVAICSFAATCPLVRRAPSFWGDCFFLLAISPALFHHWGNLQ